MNRDQFATCPRCTTALDARGDRLSCGRCDGTWIDERALLAVIAQLAEHDPPMSLAFEPLVTPEAARSCARCPASMTKHSLYGIQIDRCAEHGVWFDRAELAAALERAGLDDLDKAPLSTRLGKRWDKLARSLVLNFVRKPWEPFQ